MALGPKMGHQGLRRVPSTSTLLYRPRCSQHGGLDPTGHIVLPFMEDSGSLSSGPRPPPWLFASEPRLEGHGETESRVGYLRGGAKE